MGSVEQDTREYHDKLANYNKAIEALIPVVMEDYTFFESFLMNEFPGLYNAYSEESLHKIHAGYMGAAFKKKWMEYVEEEARRRADG